MHKSEHEVNNYVENLKSNMKKTKHNEENIEQFDCGFSTLQMLGTKQKQLEKVENFEFMTKKGALGKNIKHDENDIDAGYSTVHFSVKAPKTEKCNENDINLMVGQIKSNVVIDQKKDLDYGYTSLPKQHVPIIKQKK